MNRPDGRNSRTLSRRRLLSLSAVGAAGLAGCSGTNALNDAQNTGEDRTTDESTDDGATEGGTTDGGSDGESDTPSTPADTDDVATVGYVRVLNRHDEAHTMHVLVERDAEVVFWSSYELGTEADRTTMPVEGPWADEQANYTVHFRVDEREEWRTFDTAKTDFPCYGLESRIGPDGELGVWIEDSPESCEATTTQV